MSKFSFYFSGDELLSDSFPYKEIENGVLWEVEGKVSILIFISISILVMLWLSASINFVYEKPTVKTSAPLISVLSEMEKEHENFIPSTCISYLLVRFIKMQAMQLFHFFWVNALYHVFVLIVFLKIRNVILSQI